MTIPRKKILIIDDDRDGADALGTLLRLWGHDTEVAYDGYSGLLLANRTNPEIILVDLAMPGLDGFEVVRQLRQEPKFKRTLIAALTGYADVSTRQRAHESGFSLHCRKPLEPDDLQELIAHHENWY